MSSPNATDYSNKKGLRAFFTTLKTLDTAHFLILEGKAGVEPANGGFAVPREKHEATNPPIQEFSLRGCTSSSSGLIFFHKPFQ